MNVPPEPEGAPACVVVPASNAMSDFSAFYRATVAPLRAYLRRILRSHHDADDVAQDAYIRVQKQLRGRELEKPKEYLFRVGRNLALNAVRDRNAGTVDAPNPEAVDESPGVREKAAAREEMDRMEAILETLPSGCRAVFTLHKLHELSHMEIAAELGISRNTVEKQMARAYRLLKAAYLANPSKSVGFDRSFSNLP